MKEHIEKQIRIFYENSNCYNSNCTDLNEIIKNIISVHFRSLNSHWDWRDYSDATRILCCCSSIVTIEDLQEWGLENDFFDFICYGLRMAGDEIGYDYKGLRTIKEFAGYLPIDYLDQILKHEESISNGMLNNRFRVTVIKSLIKYSSLEDEQKKKYKFRYFDSYLLIRILMRRIKALFASKYSQYEYITIEELNEELEKPINENVFLCALRDQNDCLLAKLDKNLDYFWLSLTRNPEIDKMNYIFDAQLSLEGNTIKIVLNNQNASNIDDSNDTITIPFEDDNWGNFQDESLEHFTEYLNEFLVTGRERFELICYLVQNLHGLTERIVYLQNDVLAEVNGDIITLRNNVLKTKIPPNFFGETVNNICAIIGKNGSGKTSVFRSIMHSPPFCSNHIQGSQTECERFFVLYKLGENYYYSKSEKFKVDNNTDYKIKERNEPTDTNICYISNTFDILSLKLDVEHFEKTTGYFDLSSNYLIQSLHTIQKMESKEAQNDGSYKDGLMRYQEQENIRIRNLAFFVKEKNMDLKTLKLKDFDTEADILPQLSSGEYARWSLFAKLLSVFHRGDEKHNMLPDVPMRDNYIILFDEAELYMHPEWQRTLISDMIFFLESINKNQCFFTNITLLFSSNSPFLMSDLPDEKIRLFDGNEHSSQKTFGQNIYTILKERFFMPDGTIGAFAEKCINQAFKVENRCSLDEKAYLEYIAEIVGDKLIFHYLQSKLNTIECEGDQNVSNSV